MSSTRPAKKYTAIVPLGLLLKLNHSATGAEFLRLASLPGRMPEGVRLTEAALNGLMPQILVEDAKFKAGLHDATTFSKAILKILQLTALQEEFNIAWNKMLGDLSILAKELNTLFNENPEVNFIFPTCTNSIHDQYIRHGLLQLGIDINYPVSYQSDAYYYAVTAIVSQTSPDVAFYQEVYDKNKDNNPCYLVLPSQSVTYKAVKEVDEARAANLKQWATERNITLIYRNPDQSVSEQFANTLRPARLMDGIGTKNFSDANYYSMWQHRHVQFAPSTAVIPVENEKKFTRP